MLQYSMALLARISQQRPTTASRCETLGWMKVSAILGRAARVSEHGPPELTMANRSAFPQWEISAKGIRQWKNPLNGSNRLRHNDTPLHDGGKSVVKRHEQNQQEAGSEPER